MIIDEGDDEAEVPITDDLPQPEVSEAVRPTPKPATNAVPKSVRWTGSVGFYHRKVGHVPPGGLVHGTANIIAMLLGQFTGFVPVK